MLLDGLVELYGSMKKQSVDRYKFDFSFNQVVFDVLYFIDEVPNVLAFGIKEFNYYFEVPVKNGFKIKPFLDKYYEFCRIMGFKYDTKETFKPSVFFESFNKQIPKVAFIKNVPKPSQIAVYRNDVEEAENIYFMKWKDNNKRGHQVSPKNLEKTRKLLSYDAYKMCKVKNISSCWSADPSDEKTFTLPSDIIGR